MLIQFINKALKIYIFLDYITENENSIQSYSSLGNLFKLLA